MRTGQEAMKYILGIGDLLVGRVLVFDSLAMTMRTVKAGARRDCAVCGASPTICSLQENRAEYENAGACTG